MDGQEKNEAIYKYNSAINAFNYFVKIRRKFQRQHSNVIQQLQLRK